MHRRGPTAARTALALLATAALTIGPLPPAAGAPSPALTYAGPAYTTQVVRPPTGTGNQSKLWFHANAWWTLLLEPTGRAVRVHELMPDHTWRPTSAVVNPDAGDVGDALHDGDTVHVVSRRTDDAVYYVPLAFDAAARDYRAGAPRLVAERGARAPASIAKDTTGRLWVAYATPIRVVATYSDDGGLTWAPTILLALKEGGQSTEIAALVAYDDRIGILWSDQTTGSFQFASHGDGDDPQSWAREQALAGTSEADDHLSLHRVDGDPADTLVAAVKTSHGDRGDAPDSALIKVLVRAPGGAWSSVPVSTVTDGLNDPILQVDAATRTLHLFASRGGSIVTKQTSLDDIRFEPGIGKLFLLGVGAGLLNPTGTKDPLDARSGVVVLANDVHAHAYRHAEMPIVSPTPVPDPGDSTPPEAPALLLGRAASSGAVTLTWEAVSDPTRWSPGRAGHPASGYVVLRDGEEVATVTTTSFVDRAGADAASAIEYQVMAVDDSGNRSAPATVVVDPPAAGPEQTGSSIGVWLLAIAAVTVGAALLRPVVRALGNRMQRHREPRSGGSIVRS